MLTNTPALDARTHAAAILSTWGSHDPSRLTQNLAVAAESEEVPAADAGESERRELLAAIADAIRQLLESGQRARAAEYLPLLRHLASPAPRTFDWAYRS